ncbi:amino acid/polyamine/organocation transporter, APC superfamily [Longilinea arvoryzae]|uniref:Amino acid/polyamine/organocation transporter, APC superfamily n=1 Tax=Longilinea arvoryzae TaxID=360412 RepID=A0A0S7BDK9_9CHLR|nr:APC family permease [Longilinea arvoryzae]GAP12438.1 amino acid/polyamine/organocation transporter, APC superfamily [Longilinea arvoryzae]
MNIKESVSNIFIETTGFTPKRSLQTMLIGRPLATEDAPHQTIGKLIGLAVFSSDAMSSVAYGPQELMMILVAAGTGLLHLAFPIVLGIVGLLMILTFSYEQTIHAYPDGGGAYIVARDNLGELPAQTAGAALLTDYILTVAVSISSGVAQIVSAFPALYTYRVEIAVAMILLIMLINLRGVKESGITFAVPTYFFLVLIFATVIIGFVRLLAGTLGTVVNPPTLETNVLQPLTMFLILRSFANGTTSLTGVEAISNGITAFREPRAKNAGITLLWMAGILGSLLIGITFLSIHVGVIPVDGETVISQLARTVYGSRGPLYLLTISATTIILVMAANTAFADFPRLGALHAGDGFLPRQLTYRGSRLVFSYGIVALSVIASLLVIAFQASVTRLIPLYAIGVFLSFTLSQTGMARRWWKSGHLKPGEEIVEPGSTVRYDNGWKHKMIINGLGAFCTAVVMIVFAVTKFKDGAWVVILLTPVLVTIFFSIHRHYKNLARQLSLDNPAPKKPHIRRNRVIMPISGVHRGTLEALRFARTLSDDITAVHISVDAKETAKVEEKWEKWGEEYRLIVLNSPYRVFLEPLLDYIDKLAAVANPTDIITIVVPQFIPQHWWTSFLHTRTAESLRKALLHRENIVITEVPYQVK